MHKFLLDLPSWGVRVPSFSITMLLACLAALGITSARARREGLNPDDVSGLAVWLMGGGFLGARLLYILVHPESIQGPADILKVWQGGIVFYGCIIGGLIGSTIYWLRTRFPFCAMADAVAPALVLGSAIGRIGCFLNGCCYGSVTSSPLALRFPAGTLPWARHVAEGWIPLTELRSLPVHPTQLYSALDALLVLGLLTWYFPRRRRDGEVMALLMLTYPVARFANEALRGDEPALALGLSLSQWISLAILGAGVAFAVALSGRPRVRRADHAVETSPPAPHRPSAARGSARGRREQGYTR